MMRMYMLGKLSADDLAAGHEIQEVVAGIDKRLVSQLGRGEPPRHRHFDTVSAESDAVAAVDSVGALAARVASQRRRTSRASQESARSRSASLLPVPTRQIGRAHV